MVLKISNTIIEKFLVNFYAHIRERQKLKVKFKN